MLISTKGRYALRVMADLAEHPAEGYIPLKEIAQRQEISEKYLEAIIKILVRAKLLSGVRGKGGVSADSLPGAVYRGRDPAADGGVPGPGRLPGGGRLPLRQSRRLPHAAAVAGA